MSFSVYILYSSVLDRYYIGSTQDVNRRLEEHNSVKYSDSFTRRGVPWVLFHTIEGLSSGAAYEIEKHLKRMKSRKYLNDLKTHMNIELRLRERYCPKFNPDGHRG